MEILDHLALGFQVAFSAQNLWYCFAGVALGTIVGVLPGIGPMAAVSMLIPFMYTIGDPVSAIIFIAGIYYGTQYGGSTSAILLNLPGELGSTITAIEGYKLTQQGRAGAALAIAAIASFFAGTVSTLVIMLLAQPLANVAFLFGSPDYASLMVLGLLASVALTHGSTIKGIGMVLVGMLLGTIGTDINTGISRFTFGNFNLSDGLSFVVLVMAIFGLSEIVYNLFHQSSYSVMVPKMNQLYPSKDEFKKSIPAMMRGTVIGSVMGLLPGAGAVLSSFVSFFIEKILKTKEKDNPAHVEGVAGPEAANNAGAQTSFIPMLALGIPTTGVMALVLAALIINNIQPGPEVISNHPGLFWGLIVSMWMGNLFLLILNYPLIGIWVSFLRIKKFFLYPIIFAVCIIGAYYVNKNWFDVWMLIPFIALGYLFRLLNCEPAPLAMGFVVGPMFEEQLRRSLVISQGDWSIFLIKPISLSLLTITALILVISLIVKMKKND